MKTPYRGDQPFHMWRAAWDRNACETLLRLPATHANDPTQNLSAITRIVADIFARDASMNFADLKDEAKYACQRKNLAYDAHVMGLALDAATRQRVML